MSFGGPTEESRAYVPEDVCLALQRRLAQVEAERDALKARLEALTDDEAVEAALLALYELGRGEDWPGTIDGLRVSHVGTLLVAQVVLAAARKAVQG